jgi:hypothetical protein
MPEGVKLVSETVTLYWKNDRPMRMNNSTDVFFDFLAGKKIKMQ